MPINNFYSECLMHLNIWKWVLYLEKYNFENDPEHNDLLHRWRLSKWLCNYQMNITTLCVSLPTFMFFLIRLRSSFFKNEFFPNLNICSFTINNDLYIYNHFILPYEKANEIIVSQSLLRHSWWRCIHVETLYYIR